MSKALLERLRHLIETAAYHREGPGGPYVVVTVKFLRKLLEVLDEAHVREVLEEANE